MTEQKKRTPRTAACASARWALTDSDFLTDLIQVGPNNVQAKLDVFWAQEGHGESVVFVDDLSRTGMRVTGDQCLPPDTMVLVKVHLEMDSIVNCIARVVWSRGWREGLPVHFAGLKIVWIDRNSAMRLDHFMGTARRWPGGELAEAEKVKWIQLRKEAREGLAWDRAPELNRGIRPLEHGKWLIPDDGLTRLDYVVRQDFGGLIKQDFQMYLSYDFMTRLFSVFGVPGARTLGPENLPGR